MKKPQWNIDKEGKTYHSQDASEHAIPRTSDTDGMTHPQSSNRHESLPSWKNGNNSPQTKPLYQNTGDGREVMKRIHKDKPADITNSQGTDGEVPQERPIIDTSSPDTTQEKPEFNNGFITAIGLFLAHERDEWYRDDDVRSLTLYGATDHLYNMEIPDNHLIPKELKDRIEKARKKAFSYRLSRPSKEQVDKVFTEFKNILKALDEALWGKEVYIGYY